MTWLALGLVGVGLGIGFFGALGLSVRLVVRHPRLAALLVPSELARFALLAAAIVLLARHFPGAVGPVLGGLLVGRWLCLSWVRERGLGR